MQLHNSTIILFLSALLFCSCSGDNNRDDQKGKIESMTEQAGKEAAQTIKTPIEKAQTAADLVEQHAKEMTERKEE